VSDHASIHSINDASENFERADRGWPINVLIFSFETLQRRGSVFADNLVVIGKRDVMTLDQIT